MDFGFEDLIGLDGIDMFGSDEVEAEDIIDMSSISVIDTQYMDVDNDGFAETSVWGLDTDNDGIIDSVATLQGFDTDNDGLFDTYEENIDFGADGTIDSSVIMQDYNQDGQMDYFEQIIGVDNDGDGIADAAVTGIDSNGDGFLDDIFEQTLSDEQGYVDYDNTYENFDPNQYNPEYVVGSPVENMENWHQQGHNDSCAVVAQEFILEHVTGQDFDEDELYEYAEEMGWMNGGTSPYDVGNILVAHGMEVTNSFGNDEAALREALENGGNVIVGVDADELWYGDNDDDFVPGDGANHAIQVIGIDYSNPDDPMVIINDSGHGDGCGAMVPMDEFLDAWEDSDYMMTVAY